MVRYTVDEVRDMIKINHLKKCFGQRILFEALNIELRRGEVFALIGPNGVGKTTLMRMILGWDRDYNGEILKDEQTVIGYSPDVPEFPKILTGCEVLEYFMEVRGIEKKQRQAKAKALLHQVGLKPEDRTSVAHFSKGMKQRLAVAQSLIGDPDVLLLDEPSAGLDFFGQQRMQSMISDLRKEGKAILLNSHLLYDVEKVADRGLVFMNATMGRHFSREDFKRQSLEDIFMETAREASYEGDD